MTVPTNDAAVAATALRETADDVKKDGAEADKRRDAAILRRDLLKSKVERLQRQQEQAAKEKAAREAQEEERRA